MQLSRIIPPLLFVAVAATCTALPMTAPPEPAAPSSSPERAGRHLGFDTHIYPGDRAMSQWREHSPYEWVGYYLQSPCRKDPSWAGKRDTLEGMGWGLAVIYVGQQWWTEQPKSAAARAAIARGEATCANFRLTAAQGRLDAEDAITRTTREGFPQGTVIYLDLEYMDRVPQAMRDYYRAWVARVLADGRFLPGVYVHTRNAPSVYTDVRAAYTVAGIHQTPPFWIAGGRSFSHDSYPHEVGHDFTTAWQGVLDTYETWSGRTILIDVNVATRPSPSTPSTPYGDAMMGD